MLIESLVAFLIIVVLSSLIYMLSHFLVPKSSSESAQKSSTYGCGEKVVTKRLLVNVSLYKYLIFFVIIDSPALIIAFAALALEMINPFTLLIYLAIILAADMLLLGGY